MLTIQLEESYEQGHDHYHVRRSLALSPHACMLSASIKKTVFCPETEGCNIKLVNSYYC